jgi:hypothetical protein
MASHRIPSMMVNNRTRMHACKAAATTTTDAARRPLSDGEGRGHVDVVANYLSVGKRG